MATIETVLGPIPPQELGVTYSHDHLLWCPPPPYDEDTDLRLDSMEAALAELSFFKAAGGRALVEMTTREIGRDPLALRRLSAATGIHVIAATGYNAGKYSDVVVADRSIADLAQEMVRDLSEGMDGTPVRAGVLKASSSYEKFTAGEKKVFQAVIAAHHETGAPISTHTQAGTWALEQIKLLRGGGVAPEKIVIGHLDRRLDWDLHQAIAKTGVFLGYDQIGKEHYYPDAERIAFIKQLIKEEHDHQILLSGDLARKSYWPSYGFGNGPGFTYTLWRFVPWMLREGISRQQIDQILIDNPARAFAQER